MPDDVGIAERDGRVLGERPDAVAGAEIAEDAGDAASFRGERGDRLVDAVATAGDDDDGCSGAGEGCGDAAADAGAASGHDGRAAGQGEEGFEVCVHGISFETAGVTS